MVDKESISDIVSDLRDRANNAANAVECPSPAAVAAMLTDFADRIETALGELRNISRRLDRYLPGECEDAHPDAETLAENDGDEYDARCNMDSCAYCDNEECPTVWLRRLCEKQEAEDGK